MVISQDTVFQNFYINFASPGDSPQNFWNHVIWKRKTLQAQWSNSSRYLMITSRDLAIRNFLLINDSSNQGQNLFEFLSSLSYPCTKRKSQNLWNFLFSKSYVIFKRGMKLDQWSNSYDYLVNISQDMVLQRLGSSFPSQRDSPTTPKIFYPLIFLNLMLSDRDECESSDGQLYLIWFLLILEISKFQILPSLPLRPSDRRMIKI